MPWLLIFFLTPIAEMYLLIEVAGYIDVWPTIFLVMLTAVIGVALLKRQGLATLTRGMQRLQAGQIPAREVAEGVLLAIAGALLVTPGFVTDCVGFLLLLPVTRMLIAELMLKSVHVQGLDPGSDGRPFPPHADDVPSDSATPKQPTTIEGDFERRS